MGVGLELGVSWSGLVVNGNCSCFAGTCRVALARLSPHCALSLGDGRGRGGGHLGPWGRCSSPHRHSLMISLYPMHVFHYHLHAHTPYIPLWGNLAASEQMLRWWLVLLLHVVSPHAARAATAAIDPPSRLDDTHHRASPPAHWSPEASELAGALLRGLGSAIPRSEVPNVRCAAASTALRGQTRPSAGRINPAPCHSAWMPSLSRPRVTGSACDQFPCCVPAIPR